MSKFIYCSECGQKLPIIHKALKGYGRIIDLVSPHECLDEPTDLDLTPTEVPIKKDIEGKFVQKLNDLRPPRASTADLRDRRKEPEVKTSAPASVLNQIKNIHNSSPENDLGEGPEGSENE